LLGYSRGCFTFRGQEALADHGVGYLTFREYMSLDRQLKQAACISPPAYGRVRRAQPCPICQCRRPTRKGICRLVFAYEALASLPIPACVLVY